MIYPDFDDDELTPASNAVIDLVDAGKLGKRSLSLEGKTFLSPGLGLRWQLPFAVFRATAARGIVIGNGDDYGGRSQWTFYLSLGEEF